MDNLYFFTVSCIGLCFILKYGSILSFIRTPLLKIAFFRELFTCALCLGFWSGVILGTTAYFFNEVSLYIALLSAVYSAATCWVADYVLDIIVKHSR